MKTGRVVPLINSKDSEDWSSGPFDKLPGQWRLVRVYFDKEFANLIKVANTWNRRNFAKQQPISMNQKLQETSVQWLLNVETTGCCSASSLRNMRSKFHHQIPSSFLLIELCHAISWNRGCSHKVPLRIGRLIKKKKNIYIYIYICLDPSSVYRAVEAAHFLNTWLWYQYML